jgi:hypothetical protein
VALRRGRKRDGETSLPFGRRVQPLARISRLPVRARDV